MDLSRCPPPKGFFAAVGVRSVKLLSEQPPFIRRGRSTGRFAVGVRYERKVMAHLALLALEKPTVEFVQGPWFQFLDKSGRRWCQADALAIDRQRKIGVIWEVKYQHTSAAWWQLRWLYEPVLRVLEPSIHFGLVEICHWHDPATIFPEYYDLTNDPFRVPDASRIAVHIWNPNRDRSVVSRT